MKVGSLFDGSGGFPAAAINAGGVPLWASEVNPYAIAVTRQNIPNMIHLGSVSEINGGDIPAVDVITFGSPCQDLSIAGKRDGINGNRSGLFFQAVRIIREMRKKTNGQYPRFAVWENVFGALSSNNGNDFRCVLEELANSGGGVLMCLDLRTNGANQDLLQETAFLSPGVCLTHDFGESPRIEKESSLYAILMGNPPEKYYLSPKACAGIIRRTEKKGKQLPDRLKLALEKQAAQETRSLCISEEENRGGGRER